MISYYGYKFFHLLGVFLVVLSSGSLILSHRLSSAGDPSWRKQFSLAHGIGLVLIFAAGFGLLARLGVSWPWQGWVFAKLAIWIYFGVLLSLCRRFVEKGRLLWWLSFVAAGCAAYFAIFKPF